MTEAKSPIETAQRLFKSIFRLRTDFTLLLTDQQLLAVGEAAPCEDKNWWRSYCCQKVGRHTSNEWTSFEFEETLNYKDAESTSRLQVSRCFNQQAWSVCVRWKPPADSKPDPPRNRLLTDNSLWAPSRDFGFSRENSRLQPNVFLVSIAEIVGYLDNQIQREESAPLQGLVMVTGATNSGKSEVARGLAWTALPRSKRRPAHLVTCEGPVEKYFWKKDDFKLNASSMPPALPQIDYTPRQLGADCGSLEEAFTDALRQTPAVFYAGELRGETEIKQAVEFGGTGHLVIATAHAGSLLEAMAKTLDAVKARRAGSRAIHVPKLLAVVHLSAVPVKAYIGPGRELFSTSAIVPTLYRRTSLGLQSLVADGLAALLPYRPEQDSPSQHGTLGRQYFLRSLTPTLPSGHPRPRNDDRLARHLHRIWPDVRRMHFVGDTDHDDVIPLIDLALRDDLYVG